AENPLVRVKPGVFALREWDDKTIKAGLEPKKKRGHRQDQAPEPAVEAVEDEVEAAPKAAPAAEEPADDDDEVLISGAEEPVEEVAAPEEEEVHVQASGMEEDEAVVEEAPFQPLSAPVAAAPVAAAPVAAAPSPRPQLARRDEEPDDGEDVDAEP